MPDASLAIGMDGALPLIVTEYGSVRIHPDTWAQLLEDAGGRISLDRRTRSGKMLRRFELDVAAIAETEWTYFGDLEEI